MVGLRGTGTFTQRGGLVATTDVSGLFLGQSTGGSGTYLISGGTFSAGESSIGYGGTGTFTQQGGTVTIATVERLFIGNQSGSNGTYTLANGSLSMNRTYVGYQGVGAFIQSRGTASTNSNTLIFGYNAGASGTCTLTGGSLAAGATYVGYSGVGSISQSGGSFSTDDRSLILGYEAGASGVYTLSGGSLASGTVYVGSNGIGTLIQSGGTLVASKTIFVGNAPGASGSYVLSGGSLVAGNVIVGYDGIGTFTQSAGTFSTAAGGGLFVGGRVGASGTYQLNGGILSVGRVAGGAGTATFNFNGGTLQAQQSVTNFFAGISEVNVRAGGARIDTAGSNITFAQSLQHSRISNDPAIDGGLTKLGAGTLNLTGGNTYTGATVVKAGTLLVNNLVGSGTGSGAVDVRVGATLGGTGTIAGSLAVEGGGILSPGNGPGRLTINGSVSLAAGSILSLELGGLTAGSQYDQLAIGGSLSLAQAEIEVNVINGFALAPGQTFFVLDRTGSDPSPTGMFANAPGNVYTDAAGERFSINYAAYNPADGDSRFNDVILTVLPVPEPGTCMLAVIGGVFLTVALRRVRRHKGGDSC